MKKRHFLSRVSLFAVMAMVSGIMLTGCGTNKQPPSPSQSTEPPKLKIKVGIIDTHAGAAAAITQDTLEAFKLSVAEIAKQGGPTIEFVVRNDEGKLDQALAYAKELVMRENVDILMGTLSSSTALGISRYAKDNKIPFINWGAMSQKITGESGHRYVFSVMSNSTMTGRTAAIRISKTPVKKIMLAGSDYEYGRTTVATIVKELKKLKPDIEIVGETWWKVGEPDFIPYLTSMRNAKPDMVILAGNPGDSVPLYKAIKTTGFSKDIPIWAGSIDPNILGPLGKEIPENISGASLYLYYYPDTPENKKFVADFKAATNHVPGNTAMTGYVAGKVLAGALQKAGSADREKLIDALEGLTVSTPIEKDLLLRKEDHQLLVPIYYGTTYAGQADPQVKEVTKVPAEQIAPTIEEIQSQRAAKKQ